MNASSLKGVWKGAYILGPSYGPELHGESAEFLLFIEKTFNNSFRGKCVDTDGVGVEDYVPCSIQGFVKDDFISFTKTYPHRTSFDENNNVMDEKEVAGQVVVYEGRFNLKSGEFNGEWEIRTDLTPLATDTTLEEFCEGKWWMRKDE